MCRRRIACILLTLWALFVMPSLCLAGILQHPCESEASSHHDHSSPDDHDSGCGHEDDCSDDPCSRMTVRAERSQNDFLSLMSFELALTAYGSSDSKPILEKIGHAASLPASRINLPCAPCALPLLI